MVCNSHVKTKKPSTRKILEASIKTGKFSGMTFI